MADKIKAKLECKDILGNKQELMVQENGDLIAVTINSAKPISVKIGGRNVPIGTQDEFKQIQHIKKSDVEIVYTSLVEQLENQVDMIKPHKDFLDTHEEFDAEGKMIKAIEKMDREKIKKFPKLNTYAQIILDLKTAKELLKRYTPAIESIKQQIVFFQENYGF